MLIGKIYNFYPVKLNDDESFEACNTWHWKFFGWWFEVYTFLRWQMARLMHCEGLQFEIKVKDKDYERHLKEKNTDAV